MIWQISSQFFDSNSQVAQKADSWAYSLDELADKYDPYWQTVAAKRHIKLVSIR